MSLKKQMVGVKSCCLLVLVRSITLVITLLCLIMAMKRNTGWAGPLQLLQSVACHLILIWTEYARQCNLYVRALWP